MVAHRGLGRFVEPDSHMLEPELQPWCNAVVDDERRVSVSWARQVTQGLHSVAVTYGDEAVLIGVRLGTRPEFWGKPGYVVLRMIVEHTAVRLREPLRGRRVEVMQPEVAATRR
jgi:hypothetical protein